MIFSQIVNKFNFRGHKVKLLSNKNKIKVLGAILNKPYDPRAPKKTKKKIKSIIYNIKKFGLQSQLDKSQKDKDEFRRYIIGEINWISQFDRDKLLAANLMQEFVKVLENSTIQG
jgi:hypothetical protein